MADKPITQLAVTSTALDALIAKARQQLDPSLFLRVIQRIAQKVGVAAEEHVAIYPPPIPTSSYVRTGGLGRSITSSYVTQGEYYIARVGTNYAAAIYVIGDPHAPPRQRQVPIHQNRWEPMYLSIEKHAAQYETIALGELRNALSAYLP